MVVHNNLNGHPSLILGGREIIFGSHLTTEAHMTIFTILVRGTNGLGGFT